MSNTEKLIKKLNENKELRKLKEQQQTKDNSSVVRVQQLKKTLVTLATDLLVNKKIKASLFKNMLSLTFTNITENELNDYYNKLKGVQKDVKKAEELQGPTKIRKVTLKDFKNENNIKKRILNNNKEELNNNKLLPYERIITDNLDNVYYKFYKYMNEQDLKTVSEDYLNFKNYKRGANKDYIPIEKTEHTRKKTFIYDFNGNFTKVLDHYLLNIYRQQKFTFKLTIEFSFLRIKVDDEDFGTKDSSGKIKTNYITVDFDLRLVDNKKDIDRIINKLTDLNLVEYFMNESISSKWKFYRFLDVKFHVYEMNTPIGK